MKVRDTHPSVIFSDSTPWGYFQGLQLKPPPAIPRCLCTTPMDAKSGKTFHPRKRYWCEDCS